MTQDRSAYRGDAVLETLLRRAGATLDPAGVRGLVRGVLGAAPARDAAWCSLVAAEPSPELVAELMALKAEIAAEAAARRAPPHAERLALLRAGLKRLGVDGFVVPRSDEYQNEYVPAGAERLAWLTGFTGSAGAAIVLAERAAVFADGRYTIQVRAETDPALFEPHHLIEEPPEAWAAGQLAEGQRLGYDPWLMTPAQIERYARALDRVGARLVPLPENPLDRAWGADRPAAPLGPVVAQPLELAGKSSAEKRQEIAAALAADRRDALVVTSADSLAWLLNLRGADVPHTPLALGFALLDKDGQVDLFMDRRKLMPGLESHLGNQVSVRDPAAFGPALDALGGRRVQLDPATAASWILDRLKAAGAEIARAADPIALPKALKNPVELEGSRRAHRRDGAAMARFLAWLDGAAAQGTLTEIAASDRLEAFRAAGERFRDLSFPSISGAGANGAIVHYRASPATERALEPGSLYLIDSGAQYLDGTTDITRTVAIGMPTAEMRDRYTRVLKGHIALATAIFPKGTSGSQLDVLARLALWQAGVNYDHGTGHGVGSYLSVHEGPQRISPIPNSQALLPGMIVSNEPGYYKAGEYGIRIENLITVVPVTVAGAEREMLGFETLTLCPIDKRPIEPALLTESEVLWLDLYHRRVRLELLPQLDDPAEREWLEAATAPLMG